MRHPRRPSKPNASSAPTWKYLVFSSWITLSIIGYFVLFPSSASTSGSLSTTSQNSVSRSYSTPVPNHILVAVLPSHLIPSSHKEFNRRMHSIKKTWGKQVETVFFSREHEQQDSQDIVRIYAAYQMHPLATVHFALVTLYERYPNRKWYFIASELTYVIPENLERLVETLDSSQEVFLGNRYVASGKSHPYVDGNAGYLLSFKALEKIVRIWDLVYPDCFSKFQENTAFEPDFVIARCFATNGLYPTEPKSQSILFHPFSPLTLTRGHTDAWYATFKRRVISDGTLCCSIHSISFHFVDSLETEQMYDMLHNPSKYLAQSPEQLANNWKSSHLSGDHFPPPTSEDEQFWKLLLEHIKA